MALTGKVFAKRKAAPSGKQDASADLMGDFTEYGTLPRETIVRLGLRHVYSMPIVLEDSSTAQVSIYRAEVLYHKQWRTVYVQESDGDAGEDRHKYGL